MLKSFLIVLLLIFFSACSSKNINQIDSKKIVVEKSSNKDDSLNEFIDEFNDEFTPVKKEKSLDPLSGYNRVMTSFNDGVFTYVLNPVAKGYRAVLPESARVGVSNFFDNILFPVRFVNNILQFKFKNSAEELERFMINTTFGLLGFMDPAKEYFNINKHNEDLGQTLGYWGVGSGPHIVLPFLGPSNLRDMVGLVGDGYTNPLSTSSYEDIRVSQNTKQAVEIKAYETVNKISLHIGEYENLKKDAIDLYPFLRDIYEQRRKKLIEE